MSDYRDRWIECSDDELRIRGYYFPWGTKRIPYRAIRKAERVDLSATRGTWRIWGTANPRYWASLDPRRPSKSSGLILDVGKLVHPFITPDDVDRVEAIIRQRAGLGDAGGQAGRAPVI